MIQVRIGDLRHRLALEQAVRQDDGSGGADKSWEVVDELWAAVRPMSGQEREVSDQLAGRVTHEIWVRYRTGVKPEMRFRHNARIFEMSGRGAGSVKVDVSMRRTVRGRSQRITERLAEGLRRRMMEAAWRAQLDAQDDAPDPTSSSNRRAIR